MAELGDWLSGSEAHRVRSVLTAKPTWWLERQRLVVAQAYPESEQLVLIDEILADRVKSTTLP